MKKTELMNKVSRTFNKVNFQLKKHSPEILVVAGVVGTVASAVMACKATLKVNAVVDEAKNSIDRIHTATEKGQNEAGESYDANDSKKDLTLVYTQTGIKFVKLYGPAVALGALSITSIFASNNILRKRNVALAAAYATVDKSFKEYRNRVIDRFGKQIDHELKYNIKAKEVEEVVVNEKGEEETVKKTVNMAEENIFGSPYAKFFDECSPYWEKNAEYNLMFLRQQQNYANDLLRARGRLFLNEVYDMLGIPKTKAGQVVGWVYDTENPVGDNYVDFGIYDISREKTREFVNGIERVILLDFNVDGNVWETM